MTEASDLEASRSAMGHTRDGGMKGVGYGGLVGKQAPIRGLPIPQFHSIPSALHCLQWPTGRNHGATTRPATPASLGPQSCFQA